MAEKSPPNSDKLEYVGCVLCDILEISFTLSRYREQTFHEYSSEIDSHKLQV